MNSRSARLTDDLQAGKPRWGSLRTPVGLFFLLVPFCVSCSSFSTPPRELFNSISDAPLNNLRARLTVRAELPNVTGVFDGVLVVRPGRLPALRLQLYPDVGTKVLDIAAHASGVTIFDGSQQQNLPYDSGLPSEPARLPYLLAVTLQQHFAPLRSRMQGARRVDDGWELQLSPHPTQVETRVLWPTESANGENARSHHLGWSSWTSSGTLQTGETLTIRARSLRLEMEVTTVDQPSQLPERLFGPHTAFLRTRLPSLQASQ